VKYCNEAHRLILNKTFHGGINTLAYFAAALVTNERRFMTLTPGANVIKNWSVIYELS
jgi:hypothetical protein